MEIKTKTKLRLEVDEDNTVMIKAISISEVPTKTKDGTPTTQTFSKNVDVTDIFPEKAIETIGEVLGTSLSELKTQLKAQLERDVWQTLLADKINDPRIKKLTLNGGTVRKGEGSAKVN